ncbi:hypothetical protein [uncultured Parabacteroides sp.]|uniref:hypothetical protein n=1 Tax=uncultured Parabacteroides sp. TaxID=512312 RepID=UPI0026199869|nr:hypothetical protein [uncultured Parabacteroides sp.]
MNAVPPGVVSGVMPCELFPATAEDPHDPSTQLDMRFALGTVHVRFPEIAPIVDEERNPKPRIKREPVQPPPSNKDQNGMDNDVMCSE